jgi:protein TonB
MFQPEVRPSDPTARKRYALPLSFVLHTLLVAVLVLVPLMITDAVPTPRAVLAFVTPAATPAMPPSVPRAPAPEAPSPPAAGPVAAPVEAPPEIGAESGIRIDFDAVSVGDGAAGLPSGAIAGFDSGVVEPPPDPAPQQPIRVGGLVRAPARMSGGQPAYPPIALAARVEGDVIIEAVIDVNGQVQEARVLRSIPLLDQAALDAVRTWAYTPTRLGDGFVPVILTVTVRFRLN